MTVSLQVRAQAELERRRRLSVTSVSSPQEWPTDQRDPDGKAIYTPHPKQTSFHQQVRAHNIVLFNGGRGSGKTTSGAVQAWLESVRYQPGSRGIVLSPTYRLAQDVTKPEFFRWFDRKLITRYNRQENVVELSNGSEIAFRSADEPDSLRGANRAWCWFDEPRNVKTREQFDIVYAQLRPTMKLWMTSTPKMGWLYRLFVADPLPNSFVVDVKTSDNPYLPKEYEHGLRVQYTGGFARQELDAAWENFEDVIFDNWSGDNINADKAKYDPNLGYFWSIDDGYVNARAILIYQERHDGSIAVIAEYYKTHQLFEATLNDLRAMGFGDPLAAIHDPAAAEFSAFLWNQGIQTVGANNNVGEGIKAMRSYIRDGNGVVSLFVNPSCHNLIREIGSYVWDTGTSAAGGDPRPVKEEDHAVDSCRYLCATYHAYRVPRNFSE